MPFRLAGKKFFFTFPQCAAEKEDIWQRATTMWGADLEYMVIAKELHQDGNPHIHMVFGFVRKRQFTSPTCGDFLTNQHGNYQTCKNLRKALMYITKADLNFLEKGIVVQEVIAKHGTKAAAVAKMLLDGKTIRDVNMEFPGFVLTNLRKIECYASFLERTCRKEALLPWTLPCLIGSCSQSSQIINWLFLNIRKPRPFKQPQLWIHGPPNCGKSSLLMMLSKMLLVYPLPRYESFYDDWEDNYYDLVVIDEYFGSKKVTFLNNFVDGSPLVIPAKGAQRLKTQNIPVVVLSNHSIEMCYRSVPPVALEALNCRFECVELDRFLHIEGLYFPCTK